MTLDSSNLLDDDEDRPYGDISSRGPLPAIKDFILSRSSAPTEAAPVSTSFPPLASSIENDPLMREFTKNQSSLDEYRKNQAEQNLTSNLGLAFSQLAQGANAPKQNTQLYENLRKQAQEGIKGQEEDVARRNKVMEAIAARQSKAQEALAGREARAELMASNRADRAVARAQMQQNRELARADRQAQQAKPSEKQGGAIRDFDDSIESMKSVLNQVQGHSDWTGPIDGRTPDALVGPDQVAFRAEIGRMADQYRKAITGAGASNQELARLETRLPQTTDTYANFIAKAKNLVAEAERKRSGFLSNLENQGKNVEPFKTAQESKTPKDTSKAGQLVRHQGKLYRVGADGDTLEEVM